MGRAAWDWEWPILLLLALGGALAARAWSRRQGSMYEPGNLRGEVVIATLVGAAAYLYFSQIVATVNPEWNSDGQDFESYIECMSALKYGPIEDWNRYRYFLYPELSVWASLFSGMRLWRAASEVSLLSSAWLIVSVYIVGRVVATRPVALAGTLLVIPAQAHLRMLGTPTDYPLGTSFYALGLAGVIIAIRNGGVARHLFAGSALACYLATTPKSFPLVLVGTLAVLGAPVVLRRLRVAELGAFVLPLGLCWYAFSALDLPILSLENDLYQYQHTWIDESAPFPDIGWTPGDGVTPPTGPGGYWVPGKLSALTHLPDVVKFLVLVKHKHVPVDVRLRDVLSGLSGELGMDESSFLPLFGLLGVLGIWQPGHSRLQNLLALFVGSGIVTAYFWALAGGAYVPRYALQVTMTLPVLLLALCALPARGCTGVAPYVAWLPMFAMIGWMIGPSGGPLGRATVERWLQWQPDDTKPITQVERLRERVRPGDVVLHASGDDHGMLPPLLDGLGAQFEFQKLTYEPTVVRIEFAPSEAQRRFVATQCVGWPEVRGEQLAAAMAAAPERFRRISPCIYEDLQPGQAFSVLLPRE